jgi:hypothetical protein
MRGSADLHCGDSFFGRVRLAGGGNRGGGGGRDGGSSVQAGCGDQARSGGPYYQGVGCVADSCGELLLGSGGQSCRCGRDADRDRCTGLNCHVGVDPLTVIGNADGGDGCRRGGGDLRSGEQSGRVDGSRAGVPGDRLVRRIGDGCGELLRRSRRDGGVLRRNGDGYRCGDQECAVRADHQYST